MELFCCPHVIIVGNPTSYAAEAGRSFVISEREATAAARPDP
jgi:hypothetical protein